MPNAGGGAGSVVVRRALGSRLRALRELAGKTYDDVATAGIASKSKLHRIETGGQPVRVADIWALTRLYATDQATTDTLAAMAPGTAAEEWWESLSPGWFSLYTGLETMASRIRSFESEIIHGLLQTEEYARAVISAEPGSAPDIIESRTKVRIGRQARVLGSASEIIVIMSESCLARVVGSSDVMAAQVEHLRNLDRTGAATVLILTFSAGAFPRRGPFALLDFTDADDPSVAYVEGAGAAKYFDKPDDFAAYDSVWKILADSSTPIGAWNL